jgi:regulator of protease activity HflC (stomatin/prohibitin superfamily)
MADSLIGLGLLIVLAVIFIGWVVKITREYQRLVVFRLGRNIGEKGPGLVLLIPIVDFLIYWQVMDAANSVIKVKNFAGASQGIATTTLRAVIGDISLDNVLAQREHINTVLREKLDEVTGRWGVKVTAVEIREILPPRDIQEAMTRQMSAERNRRAVVTEAEGKREATILVAEGDKQSNILRAEGERQAAILKAEGFALALDKIYSIAKTVDAKTMSLQYLEALKALGAGASTKFIFPLEFQNFLKPFAGFAGKATEDKE